MTVMAQVAGTPAITGGDACLVVHQVGSSATDLVPVPPGRQPCCRSGARSILRWGNGGHPSHHQW